MTTYKSSGVDIDAGNKAVDLIKNIVKKTYRTEVLGSLGSFSGFFSINLKKYKNPILVSSTDGVGTKLKIAFALDKHNTVGIDAVAMCVDDVVCTGAEPIFFLDYIGCGKLIPEKVAEIIKGVVKGCKDANCSLIGGETAELPGMYKEDEYDLVGFCVGIVEKNKIIDGRKIKIDDKIIGFPSSGLHSNGYSLARKVLLEKYKISEFVPELKKTIGEELLTPTKIYAKEILNLIKKFEIKGIAHITGGGFIDNIPRILPDNCKAVIKKDTWRILPIFNLIKKLGNVKDLEMYRTFNMGIGMVIIVENKDADKILKITNAKLIGEIVNGKKEVVIL